MIHSQVRFLMLQFGLLPHGVAVGPQVYPEAPPSGHWPGSRLGRKISSYLASGRWLTQGEDLSEPASHQELSCPIALSWIRLDICPLALQRGRLPTVCPQPQRNMFMDTSQCSRQLPFEQGKYILELIPKEFFAATIFMLAQTGI